MNRQCHGTKTSEALHQIEAAKKVIELIADVAPDKRLKLSICGPREEFEIHGEGLVIVIGYDEALYMHVYHDKLYPDEYSRVQNIADDLGVDMEIQ